MRCLLDVGRAADEIMRCSCPCVPSSFFSFRPAPSRLFSSVCLLNVFPRPPGRGMSLRLSICCCGHDGGLPARFYAVALSLSLVRCSPLNRHRVCLPSFHLLSLHRMSNELVKTALADRSSIKPFQFIPIHSRSRIGCRMMCPACCLSSSVSCVVSRLACLPLTHPLRSSASPLAPPCVSLLRYVSSRRLTPSLASSHPLILPALVSHAASLCLPAPPLVSPGGAFLVSLSFRHASRLSSLRACLPSCVPLILGVRLRMSPTRSCVPLLPFRLCLVSLTRPASSCR